MTARSLVTLDEAIAQLVSLGEKDPLTIARKVEEERGAEWIAEQLAAYSQDFIAQMARQMLSRQRRSAELAVRPGDELTTAELKLRSFWVPERGWKAAKDVTPDDLRARARWEENLAASLTRRVEWYRDVAALLEEQGARTLGRFRGALPALPDAAELEAA